MSVLVKPVKLLTFYLHYFISHSQPLYSVVDQSSLLNDVVLISHPQLARAITNHHQLLAVKAAALLFENLLLDSQLASQLATQLWLKPKKWHLRRKDYILPPQVLPSRSLSWRQYRVQASCKALSQWSTSWLSMCLLAQLSSSQLHSYVVIHTNTS